MTEDDEGYEQEDEDSINLEKALTICMNNVFDADYHYKAVCRALYAQASELKIFLEKIENSKVSEKNQRILEMVNLTIQNQDTLYLAFCFCFLKNILLTNGTKDEAHYFFEILNKTDWVRTSKRHKSHFLFLFIFIS